MALDDVIDPCSVIAGAPAGINEFGLVKAVGIQASVGDAVNVSVTLRLTEPSCMMGAAFARGARERLEEMDGIDRVEVRLDPGSDWVPAEMSAGYASRLRARRKVTLARTGRQARGEARLGGTSDHSGCNQERK